MGNKSSNASKKGTTSLEDEDYLNWIREKNKKDVQKHKVISNQKGTAFHKLNNLDRNQELRQSTPR